MTKSQRKNEKTLPSAAPEKFGKALHSITRVRTRLIVFFWTLPVYSIAIWILLNNRQSIDSMMWIYIAVYAVLAIDMSLKNCPSCGKQFFVKSLLLYFLARKCVHCGQALKPVEIAPED